MEKKYCTAIVLAAGSGKRMGTKIHKQYLLMGGRPVLYYSLKAFQDSELIDEIILVTGRGEEEYCRSQIVELYGISKVTQIVTGGNERYHSVWNGLKKVRPGYVYIHDGARPFVDEAIISRAYACVEKDRACAAGMPVKDTIKIVDDAGFVQETPMRSKVWLVQTPQVFETELVVSAYAQLMEEEKKTIEAGGGNPGAQPPVTDDAMVVETVLGHPVRLFEGAYENIKITTPEDLEMAEVFLKRKC